MDGTATIEVAPTYPEFAVQHAAKRSKTAQPIQPAQSTIMSSQMISSYPVQYLPSQYCVFSRESLAPVSNFNSSLLSQLPIPSIKEFFEKVDEDEGSSGDFIQFIDTFNEQNISVKHIKDLNDDEFQMLGVKTIGWRKTILAAAKQY
jgi:SAM domain (Sterile alpha motif)